MQTHSQQQGYTVTPEVSTWRGPSWWGITDGIIWSTEFSWEMVSEKEKYSYMTFLFCVEFARLSYKSRTNTTTTWSLWNNHINHHISYNRTYSYNFSFWDNSPFTSAVNQLLSNSTLEWCQLDIFNVSNLFNTVPNIWNDVLYNHKSPQCNSTD